MPAEWRQLSCSKPGACMLNCTPHLRALAAGYGRKKQACAISPTPVMITIQLLPPTTASSATNQAQG
eukprot:7835393-Alexandrium_andersonii.AAC.1